MKYGRIELPHSSNFYPSMKGAKHSPYLAEKLIYVGQKMCYENGSEAVNMLVDLEVNDTEIYRLTDSMGEQLEEEVESGDYHEIEPLQDISSEEKVYCQVDGSMLLTREEKWKEVKLGRVFKQSLILPESVDRQFIRKSEYVAHLGDHTEFEEKMSTIVDEYSGLEERLVFVNDGAVWIHNWIKSEYPKATQILDFYHAMTHIMEYAKLKIKDKKKRAEWQTQTSEGLKKGGYDYIVNRLKKLPPKTKKQKEENEKLLTYLKNNKDRMEYQRYIAEGLLIGSGAIESAHRKVLQERMKKSGQRWSKKGLKRLMNIRILDNSGHWDRIKRKLKKAA